MKAYKDISFGNKTSPVIRSSRLIGLIAFSLRHVSWTSTESQLDHWRRFTRYERRMIQLFLKFVSLSLSLSLRHQMFERQEKVEECGIPVEVSMHIFDESDDKSLLISPEKKEKGVRGFFYWRPGRYGLFSIVLYDEDRFRFIYRHFSPNSDASTSSAIADDNWSWPTHREVREPLLSHDHCFLLVSISSKCTGSEIWFSNEKSHYIETCQSIGQPSTGQRE